MKKITLIIANLCMVIAIASCGQNNQQDQRNQRNQQEQQNQQEEENMTDIEIKVAGQTFSAKLYDNNTTEAFLSQLPLTLDMSELNGNEKYYYFDSSFPTNAKRPSGIHAGDLMLFGSDCLVLFYENMSTSYSYTPLGYTEDASSLAAALGSGSANVTFQLK